MFSTLLKFSLVAAVAVRGSLALFVNNPELVQCQVAKISWSQGKAPYNLAVVRASDPCGKELVDLGDFQTTWAEWTVNLAVGTKVQLAVIDSEDEEGYSANITVKAGSDSSCLKKGSSASSHASPSSTPKPDNLNKPSDTGSDSPSDTPTNDGEVEVLGAANAGLNLGLGGAMSTQQVSKSALVLSGLVAAFVLAL